MSAPIDPPPADGPGFGGPGSGGAESGAPKRPFLPDAIKIATELWVVVIITKIVTLVAQYPATADEFRDAIRDAKLPSEEADLFTAPAFFLTMTVLVAIAVTAISLVALWLTRRGYNWARVIFGAMGVTVVADMVLGFFSDPDPAWTMVPVVIGGVAGLGATIMLMRADVFKYCRAMAEFRKPRAVSRVPGYPQPPYPQLPPFQQGHYPPNSYQNQPYPQQHTVPPQHTQYTGAQHPAPNRPAEPTPPPYGDDQPTSDHDTRSAEQANEGRRASDQS